MKAYFKKAGIVLLIVSVTLCAITFLYEPDRCSLCDQPSYEMPCAVDIASGTVYEAPYCSEEDGCGTFLKLNVPGARVVNPFLFCRACRTKLPVFSRYGVVLVDMHDPKQAKVYPVSDGTVYTMRNYSISINENQDNTFGLTVTGTLKN